MSEELPEGWALTTVERCFLDIRNGTTAPQTKDGKGTPVSRIETVQGGCFLPGRVGYVKDADPGLVETFAYQPGDIAFSHINSLEHVGKTAIYRGEPPNLLHGMNLLRLRLDHTAVTPEYAGLYMQTARFRDAVREASTHAVNQVSINKKNLGQIDIPIAPLAEQRRIVEKVEALLTRVNAVRERLEKVSLLLKRFRESVLAKAFRGELIPTGSNFCQSNVREVDNELPDGWATVLLGDVADVKLGKMLDKAKHTSGTHLPYLRNASVRWNRFDLTDMLTMPFVEDELERFGLENGDLLVCEGGEPGRCAIWEGGKTNIKFQKALLRVRPRPVVEARWILKALHAASVTGELEQYFTGTTIKHFPREAVLRFQFRLPPLAEQRRIVATIDALLSLVNPLERAIDRTQARLRGAARSILGKAFAGEVVPTEAEVARAEGRAFVTAAELLRRATEGIGEAAKTQKPTKNSRRPMRVAVPGV